MLFPTRLALLLRNDAIAVVDVLLADHIEATIIQPSEHLGSREHFPHFLGAPVVETTCQAHLRTHPMPQEIKEIEDISKEPGVFAEILCPTLLGGVEGTDEITVLFQFGVGATQVSVQVTDGVQMVLGQ